ncbi:nucleotidyltransferase family protein [Paenibacillus sepulcri]|uniref:Nucleotidyltransferase family protein n=1 Tax=Paenibacillus sepulcri TaxID=359917 RepID=A0ABS7BV29_9BACL|nr:nucleotidyltransferase family protein [Paenibacillus sepulcri]
MINIKDIFISPNATILDALKIIDAGTLQIALVVNEDNKLLGTLTDGDVRRGILKGGSLDSSVTTIMNSTPVTARAFDNKHRILRLMRNKQLRHIPIVDDKGIVMRLELIDQIIGNKKRDNLVVLMAGGLGMRLRPLTENCPKPLLKIGAKPILEIIIENFLEYGFYQFLISVNYKADMIKEYFGDGSKWGAEITYIDELDRMGTAGSLSLIKEKQTKPILVMNGDLLTKINFQQLIDYHMEINATATMCVREFEYQIPYGVVNIDDHRLTQIEEKPTQRFFINGGIYILNPEVIEYIPQDRFLDMPDLFQALIDQKKLTSVFPIREYWLDIGRVDDFNRANGEFSEVFG